MGTTAQGTRKTSTGSTGGIISGKFITFCSFALNVRKTYSFFFTYLREMCIMLIELAGNLPVGHHDTQ